MPATYHLRLYRGDSYAWEFRFWADPDKSEPVDLSGYEVAAEIRDRPHGSVVTTMACVLNLPNVVAMTLSAAASADAPSGRWDLRFAQPDTADVVTMLEGNVTVKDHITGL